MKKKSYFQVIKNFYKNYVNFSDCTTRRDYWLPVLSYYALSLVGIILSLVIFTVNQTEVTVSEGVETVVKQASAPSIINILAIGLLIFWIVISFVSIIPMFSGVVRRYRDAGLNNRGIVWLVILSVIFSTTGASAQSNNFVQFISFLCGLITFIVLLLPSDYLTSKSSSFARYFYRQ
ncbi:DUF805 domain-containing protein [Vagococcus zengguangii]|nr:DUF805 domain-containing protein [Vagococcus zengguangii]